MWGIFHQFGSRGVRSNAYTNSNARADEYSFANEYAFANEHLAKE